jgi:uncharacterized membrane protein YkvA (DUF1232 family)
VERLKAWANAVKRDVLALYLARRDPRVPWCAKALAIVTVAYALSPIDLIPDFIPIIGYLDDLILVPLAILLAVRLIPAPVIADLRSQAEQRLSRCPPTSRAAGLVIILVWAVALALVSMWLLST